MAAVSPSSTRRCSSETGWSTAIAFSSSARRTSSPQWVRLVIVGTHSGNTALLLSKQRGSTPIVAVSDDPGAVRRMCLYWGVTPLHAPEFHDSGALLEHVVDWSRRRDLLRSRDRVVLIASTHWTATRHDMVVVHEVP